jgi:hypothetical protein
MRESERKARASVEVSEEHLVAARRPHDARRRQGARQGGGGTQLAWLPCLGHMSPLGHKCEQLAGDGVVGVGRSFGLFPGRISEWPKNEI